MTSPRIALLLGVLLPSCGGRLSLDPPLADGGATSTDAEISGDATSTSDAGSLDAESAIDAPSADETMAPCNAGGNVFNIEAPGTKLPFTPGTWTFTDANAQWETHTKPELIVAGIYKSNGIFNSLSARPRVPGTYRLSADPADDTLFLGLSGDSCHVTRGSMSIASVTTEPSPGNPDGSRITSLVLWFYGECKATVETVSTRGCVRYNAPP